MTLQHFFSMGGYARYVWPCYGLVIGLLLVNWWLPLRRKRYIIKMLARRMAYLDKEALAKERQGE